jgi:signal peptidase II
MPSTENNFRSPLAIALFVGTTVVGLALDIAIKYWSYERLVVDTFVDSAGRVQVQSDTIRVIPGYFHLHATNNYGAVFGIGQGYRWLFLLVSGAAIAYVGYLFATSGRARFFHIILGMLLAGVLGNLYDRARYGYVRDMFYALPDLGVFPWIFNVADSMLVVGVGLILVYFLFVGDPAASGRANTAPVETSSSK